jgi:hypothetical protein
MNFLAVGSSRQAHICQHDQGQRHFFYIVDAINAMGCYTRDAAEKCFRVFRLTSFCKHEKPTRRFRFIATILRRFIPSPLHPLSPMSLPLLLQKLSKHPRISEIVACESPLVLLVVEALLESYGFERQSNRVTCQR